jgi:hypothetical protein
LFDAQDVLYVPGLKHKLLSVSSMEDMGFSINLQRGKVLICLEKAIPEITLFIGVREGTLYRLQEKLVQISVHENDNLCEIWYKRLGNLHYRAFSLTFNNYYNDCIEENH